MTMLPQLQKQLEQQAKEIDQIARWIYAYIPEVHERDDQVLEAYNRACAAKNECLRSAGCLRKAMPK